MAKSKWFRNRNKQRDTIRLTWWQKMSARFSPLRKATSKVLSGFFDFHTPKWVAVKRLYKPSKKLRWFDYANPIYWVVWVIGFLYQWLISRPYLSLGPSLPAIAGILAIAAAFVQQRTESSQQRINFYHSTLERATKNNDDALARVALMSLIRRSPQSERYQVQQALLDYKMDQKEAAVRAMLRLAFSNKNSTAAAWLLGEQFNIATAPNWSPDMRRQFQELYEIAIQDAKGEQETRLRLLMANYLARESPSDAATMLSGLAAGNAELHLPAAALYLQIGDQESANRQAELAERYYTNLLGKSPTEISHRFNLARAFVIQRQEQKAVQSLSDGYKLTGDKRMLDAGGEALVAWTNRIKANEPQTPENLIKRMELLVRASKIAPTNAIVTEGLTQIAIECASNKNRQVQTLRQALLQGVSPECTHFITGTVELMAGNIDKANFHLEQAAKDNSNLPGILNNMAVAMYQKESPDLDRALSLVNAALQHLPKHEYILETRGQILLRQKKYRDAIRDLEYAVRVPELASGCHSALADAYAALGETELADSHRKMVSVKPK